MLETVAILLIILWALGLDYFLNKRVDLTHNIKNLRSFNLEPKKWFWD
jgi:hypothetical protein